jgi:transcriptional regulator with XRE-family HTH domain
MDITSPRDLAVALRGRRTHLGLTQTDVAVRAGVSRPWLSKVEQGKVTAGSVSSSGFWRPSD